MNNETENKELQQEDAGKPIEKAFTESKAVVPEVELQRKVINPIPQTEQKMEVHHHTHPSHEKKTWKNYFWEFFMLFLAVFCGFLAEYQLEHTVEKDRAREVAQSFYKELQLDSISVKRVKRFILRKDSSLQYLKHYFRDSSLTNVSKEFAINFERGLLANRPSVFEPRAAILDLLINSGSLRYFKGKELQEMSIELTIIIKEIKNRNDRLNQFIADKIDPFILQHYDALWITASNISIPFQLYKPEKIDKVEDINRLHLFATIIKQNENFYYAQYDSLNSKLQSELRKMYHLR